MVCTTSLYGDILDMRKKKHQSNDNEGRLFNKYIVTLLNEFQNIESMIEESLINQEFDF